MVIFFFTVILLYWIIERIFYFVKTRKPLFFKLGEAPNGLRKPRMLLRVLALGRTWTLLGSRKMLAAGAADFPASGARFVGRFFQSAVLWGVRRSSPAVPFALAIS